MNYYFQRIAANENYWEKPSKGRYIASQPQGSNYIKENGFGYEDWNFNTSLLIGGYIYGYIYHNPPKKNKKQLFNIAFATYENSQWLLVGFYLNAELVDYPPISEKVLSQKLKDLRQLGDDLTPELQSLKDDDLLDVLRIGSENFNWKVSPSDVLRLKQPIPLPQDDAFIFNLKRFVKASTMTSGSFDVLFEYAKEQINFQSSSNENDENQESEGYVDGHPTLVKHKRFERSAALVTAAKHDFFKKHKRYFCEICEFDFKLHYGNAGKNYIEAHHIVPLSNLNKVVIKRPSDLIMVCSNCHSMLHHGNPWLTVKQVKQLWKQHHF